MTLRLSRSVVLGAVVAALLAGCAEPRVLRSAGPRLDLLGPRPEFALQLGDNPAAAGWALAGEAGPGTLGVVDREGVPALRIRAGNGNLAMARRTDVPIGIMPFLSWSWLAEVGEPPARHPVRLAVGFKGGRAKPKKGFGPFGGGAGDLPDHDRVLVLTWEPSALTRGSLFPPPPTAPNLPARYAVRGGSENTGTWWLETVDLADLYRRSWPRDQVSRARIAFIGIVSARQVRDASPGRALYVSGLRLSR